VESEGPAVPDQFADPGGLARAELGAAVQGGGEGLADMDGARRGGGQQVGGDPGRGADGGRGGAERTVDKADDAVVGRDPGRSVPGDAAGDGPGLQRIGEGEV